MAEPPAYLDLFEETRRLLLALEERGIEYALVGAVALAVHGVPRATTDVDLLIRPKSLEAGPRGAHGLPGGRVALGPSGFPT